MGRFSIGGFIYLIIGLIMASNRGYLTDLGTLSNLFSAIIAIAGWPLLFLGANLHIVL
jgi:hypothetical protein